jgi:hypothetical protein
VFQACYSLAIHTTTRQNRRGENRCLTSRIAVLSAEVVCFFCLAVCGVSPTRLFAQDSEAEIISREYRIKAAYLYQVGRYIEWPTTAFATPTSPFVIGVFAESAITPDLLQIAQSKKIQDRPIEVRSCNADSNFSDFHILFLPATLPPKVQMEVIRKTAGKNVLLIGEGEVFSSGGGCISFVIEENKIRLYIARKVIERQGLTVSAKLLQVGHIVD